MKELSLSVVMPALNEEKNISLAMQNALDALVDYKIKGELICVNDGSKDNTAYIMKQKQNIDSRVRIITHDKPMGFGSSFWAGASESKMDAVLLLPGDNENDPWEILRYFHLLEHVDIVIPFVYNPQVRSISRRIISSLYRTFINTTFGTNLNYTNGTVIYRTFALNNLTNQNSSFFFQTDILMRLIKNGYLYAEVPYRLEQREEGSSAAISLYSLVQVVIGYLKLLVNRFENSEKNWPDESMTAKRRNHRVNSKYNN